MRARKPNRGYPNLQRADTEQSKAVRFEESGSEPREEYGRLATGDDRNVTKKTEWSMKMS
jgi:nucleoside phosphorylase